MFLFVYGTLRSAIQDHPAVKIGEGSISGRLYDFGAYPGVVDGDGVVRGEVYRLDQAEATLAELDKYESVDEGLYERVTRSAILADGSKVETQVYLYKRDTSRARLIASGDWTAR